MPLQATSGAASYDAFGGGIPYVPAYIEEVFSTWLYTGNSSTQTITNGIDLSTKGGLVWLKQRSAAGGGSGAFNVLSDTARGIANTLVSSSAVAQNLNTNQAVNSVSTTGFVVANNPDTNLSGQPYASWTFREQPKFFDIVTYTGNGTGQTISHNLGSVPGCVMIKTTSTAQNWLVYHRSLAGGIQTANPCQVVYLNSTSAATNQGNGPTNATATSITLSDNWENSNGVTYVMYLFAHNAGGFGLTGTDNVISCGSFASASGTNFVTLGYEPQFILFKNVDAAEDWTLVDIARGMPISTGPQVLRPNTSGAETFAGATFPLFPTATGFGYTNFFSGPNTYIYIAIRRGPMKVPTTGTSVFGMSARSGTGANATVTGGQTDDAVLVKNRGSAVASLFAARLTGTNYLVTSSAAAQVAAGVTILQANPWDVMDGVKVGTTSTITNASANTYINYLFKRAPSFMDVVCYTGTGSATTQAHNLGVVPEMMIVKSRSAATAWIIYHNSLGNDANLAFSTGASSTPSTAWNTTTPTSSVFSLGTAGSTNGSGVTFVAYLFATCAGVSKVGSYTGNGTTQTIDCGITAGARFVLIKRTDSTGDWYVYDTARGMTVLTDPYWLANTADAEVATLGSVTTVATGFALNSAILAAINVNAGTYIFLAIS